MTSTAQAIAPVQSSDASVAEIEGMIEYTKSLIPMLRARSEKAAELRRLPDETINELHEAGLWRILTPRKYGGLQGQPSQFCNVLKAMATGCGSTSWVFGLYLLGPFVVISMSDEVQEEYFSVEGARSCQAINPVGQVVACPGGYRLTGRWPFMTGQHHAHFAILATILVNDDGSPIGPAYVMVPREEMTWVDDWDVSGLRGTGSNSLKADGLFVPKHRLTMMSDIIAGTSGSTIRAEEPDYQAPLIPLFGGLSAATPIGLATSALEILNERIHKRGITYSPYKKQDEATVTHFQMAEAQMKFDQANFHAERGIQTVEMIANDPANMVLRARSRADAAWTVQMAREVVNIAQNASGASSISMRDPLRRVILDMEALSLHSYLLHSTCAELYGRVLSGQDPLVPYI